jgi:uncharacterized protein (UPF0216 family)
MKEADLSQSSKMRVRLFTQAGIQLEDRLVDQARELFTGPNIKHDGPISLELNLKSKDDVEAAMIYIDKLKGKLPIEPKTAKPKKEKIKEMLTSKEPVLELMNTVKAKAKSQEQLMDLLREYDFRFVAADVVIDWSQEHPDQITIKEKHHDYQFMVRMVKEAKNPENDKYDWRLVFGIKIIGDKEEKVQVYLWGVYEKTWTLPWEKAKEFNFKKVNPIYIFPEFMDYNDRKKWRAENRKAVKDPNFKPNAFYEKWKPYIKVHGS